MPRFARRVLRPALRLLHAVPLLLLAVAPVARAAAPEHETGLPFFDVFDPRDYHGHTQVWSTVADAAGVLYFGNYGGVLVYDGARWSRIEIAGTSFVRALAVDAHDRLWIGAVDELGYAATDATGRRTFVSLRDRLPPAARTFGEVWRVVLTARGPLFQSNTWLLRWDGRAFATLPLPQPGSWQAVLTDSVWITSGRHGWFELRDDGATLSLAPLTQPPGYAGEPVIFALPTAAPHQFILGTSRRGLLRWDGQTVVPFPTDADAALTQVRSYRAARLDDGRFVVTTLQAGAFLFNPAGQLLAHLDESAGLPDNTVLNAFVGRGDQIWLALDRGLVRVDARPWLTWLGPASGAPQATLGAPARYRDTLYLAGNTGLYRLAPAAAGAPARLTPVPGFRDYLYSLTVVDDALIGGGEQGFFEWRGDTRRPLPGDTGNAFTFGPARAQSGRWFALLDGSVVTYRRDGGEWRCEGPIADLHNIRSLLEEADGTWWFGTPSDGLWQATFPDATTAGPGRPRLRHFTTADGLPAAHGWVRMVNAAGRPLLLTERGFFRFEAAKQRFEPAAEFGAHFTDGTRTARALATDTRGGQWIATRAAGQAELVTPIELGLADADGWHPLDLPQLARLDDITELRIEAESDRLWISGHGGVIVVDLARWRAAPAAPAPILVLREAADAAGDRLPLAGGWQLPYARRSLHVSFAAPALAGDPAAEFESTLRGAVEPVTLRDASAQREYPALAPGDYTLDLRARSGSGRWSTPLTLSFTVLPPWWGSGVAWFCYAVAGSAGIAFLVRLRTGVHRLRAEALERVVAARTEELRRNNTELARLHQLELDEKAAARLAEEKARLELLRYQLNPHFLLNAFTTLRSLVFAQPDAASTMIGRLAEFCRFALTRSDASGGTVADEAQLIETYLATEKARWRDELDATVEVDPAARDRRLPPFLLQPLVENAVKYGGRTSPGQLVVRVRIAADGPDGLRIEIANTGAWVDAASPHRHDSTGLGLDNLRQRLRRYYPDAHSLEFRPDDGWVRVLLHLQRPARDPFAATPPAH